MYLDRSLAGPKHLCSGNPESDMAEYTVLCLLAFACILSKIETEL